MPHEFHFSDWLPFPIDLSHDEVLICTQLNAHGFFKKNLIQIAMKPWQLLTEMNSCFPLLWTSCWHQLYRGQGERSQRAFTSGQNCHRRSLNIINLKNLSPYALIVKLAVFPFQIIQNIAYSPFPNNSEYKLISGCQCAASKDPPHSELSSLLDNLFQPFLVLQVKQIPFQTCCGF